MKYIKVPSSIGIALLYTWLVAYQPAHPISHAKVIQVTPMVIQVVADKVQPRTAPSSKPATASSQAATPPARAEVAVKPETPDPVVSPEPDAKQPDNLPDIPPDQPAPDAAPVPDVPPSPPVQADAPAEPTPTTMDLAQPDIPQTTATPIAAMPAVPTVTNSAADAAAPSAAPADWPKVAGLLLKLQLDSDGHVLQVVVAQSGGDPLRDAIAVMQVKKRQLRINPPLSPGQTLWVDYVLNYGKTDENSTFVP